MRSKHKKQYPNSNILTNSKSKFTIHLSLATLATLIWIIEGRTFGYIAAPIFFISLPLLLLTAKHRKKPTYQYLTSFVIHLFIAPAYILIFSAFISFISTKTTAYTIGFDIQTSQKNICITNYIEIIDRSNPIERLKLYYSGYYLIQSKSNGVMINKNNAILTLISPLGSDTAFYLKNLPESITSNDMFIDKKGVRKYKLSPKLAPAIIHIINKQQATLLTAQEYFENTPSQHYSVASAWVTFEKIKTIDEMSAVKQWLNTPKDQSLKDIPILKELGIAPERFEIHKKSKLTLFL